MRLRFPEGPAHRKLDLLLLSSAGASPRLLLQRTRPQGLPRDSRTCPHPGETSEMLRGRQGRGPAVVLIAVHSPLYPQYFRSYTSVDLRKMADAFKTDERVRWPMRV